MVLDEPDDPLSKHKGHEVITILRYVHGAKTIKLYVQCSAGAGRGVGRSKNLVQWPTVIDCLLLSLFSFRFQ